MAHQPLHETQQKSVVVLSNENLINSAQNTLKMQSPGNQKPSSPQVNYKTGSLQQSQNYVWNTADVLGRGATAVVFFGRHRVHGEVCAVKVFHERESRHHSVTRQREIEVLRSLTHRNIVNLLALERESVSGNQILVMEYCSGGSLYNMLESPQYGFGFPEVEFILFLGDLTSGMHYLRMKGFIHRDIKPGNIMRFIGEDGRSIYKITDFGASRELQDDETFMSLYGTEEYLFPGMYERAVLRDPHPGNQRFDASVDIWSLGVTIYHVSSGQLPFQPYGGRANAATMHMITSKKPSGVISGIQEEPSGPIAWHSSLPSSCLLSDHLQQMLVVMLSGLMENEKVKMWQFDRYFEYASGIVSMISIKLFDANTGHNLIIYVRKTERYSELEQKVSQHVGVLPENFLILWTDRELKDLVKQEQEVQNFPRSVLKDQLFLINRTASEYYRLKIFDIPAFPEIDAHLDVIKDAQVARRASTVAHYVYVVVDNVISQQNLLLKAESQFRRFVKQRVSQLDKLVPELRTTLEETQKRQSALHNAYSRAMELFDIISNQVNKGTLALKEPKSGDQIGQSLQELQKLLLNTALEDFYKKIEGRLHEIEVYLKVLSDKIVEQENNGLMQCICCLEEDYCLPKAENLKQKIAGISTTMTKHKKYRDLHAHEEFIHKCEMQKLQENCVSLLSIAQDHCLKNLHQCFSVVMKQTSILVKHLARTGKVEQNISNVQECQKQLSKRLTDEEGKAHAIVSKVTHILGDQLAGGAGAAGQTSLPLAKHSLEKSGVQEMSDEPRPGEEGCETKKARTEMLGRLAHDLTSLQNENESLRQLLSENSEMMKKFLFETSNLQITGSLDSDHRTLAVPD